MVFRSIGSGWLSKRPETLEDFDTTKWTRRRKAHGASEAIIEGVTHDSIAEFVEASRATRQTVKDPSARGRLRRLFKRG